MTFNEPRVVAALGYENGLHAPGRCSKVYGNCRAGNSATEPYIVAHNLIQGELPRKAEGEDWNSVGYCVVLAVYCREGRLLSCAKSL